MTLRSSISAAVFVIALAGISNAARANTVQFSLDYSGAGFSTQALLSAVSTPTAGEYLITGITGFRNSIAITGVVSPNGYGDNDNEFFPALSVPFDVSGFAFSAGGEDFNLYADQGFLGSPVGVDECNSVSSPACLSQADGSPLRTFSIAQVPEPSTLALLGLGLVGLARRRRATI